jgi:diguanylate cyclase (GGDEF)-like protein
MDARTAQKPLGRWPALAAAFAVLTVPAVLAAAWGLVDTVAGWNIAFTASAVCALAGMLAARHASAAEHRYRWGCWAAAAALWVAGQLAWDVFSVIGFPSSPNIADGCWYGFAVLVMAGLLRAPAASWAARAVAVVEALPLVAAAMALTFAELWDHGGAAELTSAVRLSALAYPALYVSAAILTLQVMVGGSLRQVRGPGPRLVLLGIVIQAVAFILWSEQLLTASYVMGETIIDPLWVAGLLAIGAGGVLAGGRPEPPVDADEMSRRGGILPAFTFVALVAAFVHMAFGDPPLGALLTLAAGVLISGGTMIVRAVLLERRLGALLGFEREAREELAGREAELARLNARLREDSRRDPLTGLRNRRALVEDLPDVELDARRRGQSIAIAICDVDRFKAYNDMLGHIAGDQALRAIAATVRMQLRAGDAAYRYGGEELVLLLRNADERDALAAAERVRAAVESAGLPHPADPRGIVTVSIGVAAGRGEAPALLSHADRALYEAKNAGRNGVRAAAGEAAKKPKRRRTDAVEQPLLRHLRGMLDISRAAASGRGPLPVLEAMAELIQAELHFQTVAVNIREGHDDDLRVVLVAGDEEARGALLGNVNAWATWHPLLDPVHDRLGSSWLPAGSYDWDTSADPNVYTSERARLLGADAWDPEDMLLLPLRGATGEVLGVVSVDEPLAGQRPTDDEVRVLMAVADHTALALEHVLLTGAGSGSASGEAPELRLAAAMLLAETLDLRDAGTAEHSRTVGGFARDTAAALGLAPARVDRLQAAGVLHDLGKLGIADAILHKAGPLTDGEWTEMTRHPEIGARILEHAGLRDIAAWVLAHHERLDGRGYPGGLIADEIPLESRVLAVADAYEAMIADRPYRTGMPAEEARAELERCAGTQFDPTVVEAFLGTLRAPRPRSRLGSATR